MVLQPFWNFKGICEHLEPLPDDWGTWKHGDSLEPEDRIVYAKAREMLGSEVVFARLLASSVNITTEITLSDGRIVILRRIPIAGNDQPWLKRKFDGEIGIMHLLESYKTVPAPRTLEIGISDDCLYLAIEKLPGVVAFNCYGSLPPLSKASASLPIP
ncbi:hypothetical protein MPER_12338 [Moniliophthora perniciosa FA553]|nr:hypothetical protein MPER_12338 [Moniliophthora perniciosa FA553]